MVLNVYPRTPRQREDEPARRAGGPREAGASCLRGAWSDLECTSGKRVICAAPGLTPCRASASIPFCKGQGQSNIGRSAYGSRQVCRDDEAEVPRRNAGLTPGNRGKIDPSADASGATHKPHSPRNALGRTPVGDDRDKGSVRGQAGDGSCLCSCGGAQHSLLARPACLFVVLAHGAIRR